MTIKPGRWAPSLQVQSEGRHSLTPESPIVGMVTRKTGVICVKLVILNKLRSSTLVSGTVQPVGGCGASACLAIGLGWGWCLLFSDMRG